VSLRTQTLYGMLRADLAVTTASVVDGKYHQQRNCTISADGRYFLAKKSTLRQVNEPRSHSCTSSTSKLTSFIILCRSTIPAVCMALLGLFWICEAQYIRDHHDFAPQMYLSSKHAKAGVYIVIVWQYRRYSINPASYCLCRCT
jgi:hypothetical protein